MTNDEDRSLDELLASLDRDPPPPRAGLEDELLRRLRATEAPVPPSLRADATARRPWRVHESWLAAAGLLIGVTLALWKADPRGVRHASPPPNAESASLAELLEESRQLEKDLRALERDQLEHCLELARQSFARLDETRDRGSAAPTTGERAAEATGTETAGASLLRAMDERERLGLERLVWLRTTRPSVVGADALRARSQEIAEQYAGTWIADEALRFAGEIRR